MTATAAQSPLDQKILAHFPGLVVRKDLTTELKQNAVGLPGATCRAAWP